MCLYLLVILPAVLDVATHMPSPHSVYHACGPVIFDIVTHLTPAIRIHSRSASKFDSLSLDQPVATPTYDPCTSPTSTLHLRVRRCPVHLVAIFFFITMHLLTLLIPAIGLQCLHCISLPREACIICGQDRFACNLNGQETVDKQMWTSVHYMRSCSRM